MRPVDAPELGQFWSGAVGFFSYDVVRHIESLPNPPKRALDYPDACFVFTDALVVIDNWRGQARVIVSVPVPAGANDETLRELYDKASVTLANTVSRLHSDVALPPLNIDQHALPAKGTSMFAKEDFLRAVDRIKEYILAGDVFQALIARRIELEFDFDSTTLYRALRALNPSPYMYHLCLDGLELVGSSPELLVRVADNRVTVRPIAGTRPRGRTPEEDTALAAELLADEKERAEHVMLVDLGRNDVGRLARYGTVEVTDLMVVEKYSHVFHIVSQVEGELRGEYSALDAFRAVFPAGTMSGAPKVRAMEIIDELEPERRGRVRRRTRVHRCRRSAHGSRDHHSDVCDCRRNRLSTGGWRNRVRFGARERVGRNRKQGPRDAYGHRPCASGVAGDNMSVDTKWSLVSVEGDRRFFLPVGKRLVLGRETTSDLPILDVGVSRRHAEVCATLKGLEIRDLGSRNGTYVNTKRVSDALASVGDRVTFGGVEFTFTKIEEILRAADEHPPRFDGSSTQVHERAMPSPMAAVDAVAGRRLAALVSIAQRLGRLGDLDALLERIVDDLFEAFPADRVAVLLRAADGTFDTRVARDRQGANVIRPVPRAISEGVADRQVALLTHDATTDTRTAGASVMMQSVRSALAAPLLGDGRVSLGVIYATTCATPTPSPTRISIFWWRMQA